MKSTDIYPVGDLVLVEHLKNERKSTLIVTLEDDKFSGYTGRVLKLGPLFGLDRKTDTFRPKYEKDHASFLVGKGDIILFERNAGVLLPKTEDGVLLVLLTPRQILAVEKKEANHAG